LAGAAAAALAPPCFRKTTEKEKEEDFVRTAANMAARRVVVVAVVNIVDIVAIHTDDYTENRMVRMLAVTEMPDRPLALNILLEILKSRNVQLVYIFLFIIN
jgi:hypothetical protein